MNFYDEEESTGASYNSSANNGGSQDTRHRSDRGSWGVSCSMSCIMFIGWVMFNVMVLVWVMLNIMVNGQWS